MTETVQPVSVAEYNRFVKTITWKGLGGADSGQMAQLPRFADKCVHVFGTFGAGTVTLYGSNDPAAQTDYNNGTLFGSKTASWIALTDTLGNNIALTSAGLKPILEDPLYILPVVTGGTGSNLTVIICAKKEFA
ncbi:MAG: hypothetical protein KGJ90_06725 [Patescibacteria group bacterium]|nr:hypothetical protein [Patescibacteria group bacterium]